MMALLVSVHCSHITTRPLMATTEGKIMNRLPPLPQNNQGCKGRYDTQIRSGPVQPVDQGAGAGAGGGSGTPVASVNALCIAVVASVTCVVNATMAGS